MNGDEYNEPRHAKEIVGAGALCGLAGGLLMLIATAVMASLAGLPLGDFGRAISAVFRGPAAMGGGAGDVFLGLVVHLAVAIVFGVLFAWFVGRATSDGKALLGALVYALAVWALMIYIVVRAAVPELALLLEGVRDSVTLLVHLLFGLPLAFAPRLQRRIGGVPGTRSESEHEWVGRRTAAVPAEG